MAKIDTDLMLIDLTFLMKAQGLVSFTTTLSEACDWIDWLNENPAFKRYDRIEQDKFNNKFYHFNTYDDKNKRKTITINVQDIKAFETPYADNEYREDLTKFKVIEWRNKRR